MMMTVVFFLTVAGACDLICCPVREFKYLMEYYHVNYVTYLIMIMILTGSSSQFRLRCFYIMNYPLTPKPKGKKEFNKKKREKGTIVLNFT